LGFCVEDFQGLDFLEGDFFGFIFGHNEIFCLVKSAYSIDSSNF
jgi:hypothetical protein